MSDVEDMDGCVLWMVAFEETLLCRRWHSASLVEGFAQHVR